MKMTSGVASVLHLPATESVASFSPFRLIAKVTGLLLTLAAVIWFSVLIYIMLYYVYIPASEHSHELHFWFKPCESNPGKCSNQYANFTVNRRETALPYGQHYKLLLDLEMPESAKNLQAGTFMVQCSLIDMNGEIFNQALRMASLKYHSWIVRVFRSVFMWPLYFLRFSEEKQMVEVELFTNFVNSRSHELSTVALEIQNRWINIYTAQLRFQAEFTGIKYLMFHHPVITAGFSVVLGVFMFSYFCQQYGIQ